VLLTRLGIERLWGGGPEGGWAFMRYWVRPATLWLAPGSFGYGLERMPTSGGVVLAVNHLSAIDPPLVGCFSRRAMWYMMKSELTEIPFVGEALTWAGGFPIRRGESDREGLRRARELVRDGHLVSMFPEGTRQRLGYPGEFQPGAAMIALHEQVPVLPCGVESFGWSINNRRPCCVVFGEPLSLEGIPANGHGFRQGTEVIHREVLRLWRMAAEAVAAGFPPALPDGAPRAEAIPPGHSIRTEGEIRKVSDLDA
jgi:1-acyl-sn-glycerol-3-phosphate acyltransferase